MRFGNTYLSPIIITLQMHIMQLLNFASQLMNTGWILAGVNESVFISVHQLFNAEGYSYSFQKKFNYVQYYKIRCMFVLNKTLYWNFRWNVVLTIIVVYIHGLKCSRFQQVLNNLFLIQVTLFAYLHKSNKNVQLNFS